ncbi:MULTISPECIES: hypothetical protein [unclassified Pseudonocardia]|nr:MULTISPECIES: hypothetical protein [unclassified Pseudonocardia]
MELTVPLKGSTAGRQYAGCDPRALAMRLHSGGESWFEVVDRP